MDLSFFDAHCMVGKRADRKPGEPWSVESLLDDMRRCTIASALVSHATSRDYDPRAGNGAIADLVANHPELHGCWAILPPATGELPDPESFVREMIDKRIEAGIAYPKAHTYSLSDWSVGPLLRAFDRNRIPLLLPNGEYAWDDVDRICRAFPYMPLILTGLNYRQLRHLLPLWEVHRNLFVDISWVSIHDGLTYLEQRGYIGQVLFGTNYPLFEPGAAVTMVTYAELTDEHRKAVAGETLRRLIRGIGRAKK
jgi:predicted TIM-barrel fold metal-dependent hydrolase